MSGVVVRSIKLAEGGPDLYVCAGVPDGTIGRVGDYIFSLDASLTYGPKPSQTSWGTGFGPAADLVTSVAGRIGAVVLTSTDVGLANVDNTSNATERAASRTLTNARITKRVLATAGPGAIPTFNTDSYDVVNFTAIAAAITSMSTNHTGTPVAGDTLRIALTDDGTPRTITWGAKFEASTVSLPGTTVASTRMDLGFVWNTATSKWRCVGYS